MFKIKSLMCTREGKDDMPCLVDGDLRCIRSHNMQFVWCEHLRADVEMPEGFKLLEGTVRDNCLDCGHIIISDGSNDQLHGTLALFEGKKVMVVISEVR